MKSKRKRNVDIHFRLNKKEKEEIQERAMSCGMNISEYIIYACLNAKDKEELSMELSLKNRLYKIMHEIDNLLKEGADEKEIRAEVRKICEIMKLK